MKKTLSYDDVLLVPQYSDINSRSEVSLESKLGNNLVLNVPIFSSPMDTISEAPMAVAMSNYGGSAIIHRYNSIEEQVNIVNLAQDVGCSVNIGAAVGISDDYLLRAKTLKKAGANFICVDVAHGHHILMKEALQDIRVVAPDVHIMAGNVATLQGVNDLADWGADSVRCNIGGGSICSTRIQTGHGMPGLQTIFECAKTDRDVAIIADGGIRNSGDIVKAIAAGADAVMCGSLLSGTTETPGNIFEDRDGFKYKTYRGMASKEAQIKWRGHVSSEEGVAFRSPYKGPVNTTLDLIKKSLQSSFSYSGVKNIKEFRYNSLFTQITQSGMIESKPHILQK